MSNILRISEASTLALHSMIILAVNQDKLISVNKIAEELGVSMNHLSKVLQRLVKADLVISIKGAKGGFKLAKNPQEITFMEIYETMEGKWKPSGCLLDKISCKGNRCIMENLVISVNDQVKTYFEKTRLSEFI